ncbi:uncharacterized protein LOC132751716 [Ruditapes philippinarum]|uniref:uncharacterized protein LOC132751716 n=1 Tax=Ruditapes philippinarum TaxID=129788 RepID=UPI00295A70FA|nr:uncharacterized protein LOC132751716 [Ruditapes philippinarum]
MVITQGRIFICGDFNSRVGELDDHIAGIDQIPSRDVKDYTVNAYGEILIDFLINSNFCILNGRNFTKNDFTSVSVKGASVVDYCLVPHDSMDHFSDFCVTLTSDVINNCKNIIKFAPSSIPDHSLLSWNILCNITRKKTDHFGNTSDSYDKFDRSYFSNYFLCNSDILSEVNSTIDTLEQGMRTQNDVNIAYDKWCEIVKNAMYENVPYKSIKIGPGTGSKKRRPGKPWWTDNLSDLWCKLSIAEKQWLQCYNRADRVSFKAKYVSIRKQFDAEVQRAKRRHWYNLQKDILNECNVDRSSFWKSVGRIGITQANKKIIPDEVVLADGSVSADPSDVLLKWKIEFSNLFNNPNVSCDNRYNIVNGDYDTLSFNSDMSVLEVKKVIDEGKLGKANGIDGIPTEALKNDTAVMFMHALFNVCFKSGTIPNIWGKNVINPIPKSASMDPRNPLSYRGISLTCSVYKLYCAILNNRLSNWAENRDVIVDEQNGFRKKRSTIDHLFTLTNIIDTRKKRKQSTFAAFIDFKKAYDYINRDLLWKKLYDIGIKGKMLGAVQSLYDSVYSCVRINSKHTEWFTVKSGLRQGCILSPLLFNLYINDLAVYLKSLDIGIDYGSDKICMLLYADDIVLLAKDEKDLQCLLNALNNWCSTNDMYINSSKSQIVHFRPLSVCRTSFSFICGVHTLNIVDRYMYLGLMLQEHLDFNVTAKVVAQSASRALGLLIAKCKSSGGLPYDVFTHLYDSTVWPTISYGSAIWGYRSYSCVNAVQFRAMRFFLGVGRYTPNVAVSGEMGWISPEIRQWKSIAIHLSRVSYMLDCRVNK